MPAVATIGIYGFDLAGFLGTLKTAEVGTVVDVRQRRGVRGPEYASTARTTASARASARAPAD